MDLDLASHLDHAAEEVDIFNREPKGLAQAFFQAQTSALDEALN